MNNKVIIGILAAVLIGGGAIYLVTRQNADTQMSTNTNGSVKGQSLKDLLAAGKPVRCTFTDAASRSNGTFYVAGGKVRGDFTSTMAGKVTTAHMIVENNAAYIWADGTTMGFKSTFDKAGSASGSVDANADLDYRCVPWTVDGSLFVRPGNIQFSETGSFAAPTIPGANVNGGAGAGAGANVNSGGANANANANANVNAGTNWCAICATMTGNAQAQCKAAYGCK